MLSNGNLLSGHKNGEVFIWNPDSFTSLGSVKPLEKYIYCILELPDGSVFVAGHDTDVYFYNMTNSPPVQIGEVSSNQEEPFVGCTSDSDQIYIGDKRGNVVSLTPATYMNPQITISYESNLNEQILALIELGKRSLI